MKLKIFFLCFAFLAATQAAILVDYAVHYSTPGFSVDSIESDDNFVFLLGTLQTNSSKDVFLAQCDKLTGREIVRITMGNPADNEFANDMSLRNGTLYVAGEFYGTYFEGQTIGDASLGKSDAFLVKFVLNGSMLLERQWVRLFRENPNTKAQAVEVASDGSAIIAGVTGSNSDSTSTLFRMFAKRISAQGQTQWTQLFTGGSTRSDGKALAIDQADNIFMAGISSGAYCGNTNGGDDIILSKRSPTTGAETWCSRVGSPANDQVSDLVYVDNTLYIIGSTTAQFTGINFTNTLFGSQDAFVVALNLVNNSWTGSFLGTPYVDYGLSLDRDILGNVLIGIFRTNSSDILVTKFSGQDFTSTIWTAPVSFDSGLPVGSIAADSTEYGYFYVAGLDTDESTGVVNDFMLTRLVSEEDVWSQIPSPSPSPSSAPTPSATPSTSVQPTPSSTPSVSPSADPSPSTSSTPTPSTTPSVTPSSDPTPSPSSVPTSSTSPSRTPSPVPSASSTPDAGVNGSGGSSNSSLLIGVLAGAGGFLLLVTTIGSFIAYRVRKNKEAAKP